MMCSYKEIFLCIVEKTLLTIEIFKYERSKTWIVMINLQRCRSLSNMFDLMKYGSIPLKMTFRVALTVLFPGVTIQNMTELSLIQSYRRLEMRTRFIVVPGERRRTGGS